MTKAELLQKIEAQDWCDALVGTSELQETKPNGDKWYLQNFREINGESCIYRNIHFYVIDEGKVGERAYFKDRAPMLTIKTEDATIEAIAAKEEPVIP